MRRRQESEPPLGWKTQTDEFLKRKVFLSLAGDGKHSKMTYLTTAEGNLARKRNYFSYSISMSLIKDFY